LINTGGGFTWRCRKTNDRLQFLCCCSDVDKVKIMASKRRKRSVLTIAVVLVVLVLAAMVQFFFNPMGLGPEPETVLSKAFFDQPARDLDSLQLLVDGRQAFEEILSAVDAARKTIHVQTFIWKNDDIGRTMVAKLKAAADRGVHVVVRKDMLGTVFELGDVLDGNPSPVFTRAGLKDYPGIDTQLEPFAETDHSKYFIIDNRQVILGGMNIADEYHTQWHDYMVAINSAQWTRYFNDKVMRGKTWPLRAPFVITVNDRERTEIRTAMIEIIDHAERSVILEHAYFSDAHVMAALRRAVDRDVSVKVILPEKPDTHGDANKVTINRLMATDGKKGVTFFLFPRMSHAKVALVDDAIAAVGSANLTPRSMLTSREIVLFVHGEKEDPFIERLRLQLAADMAESRVVTEPYTLSFTQKIRALVGKYVW